MTTTILYYSSCTEPTAVVRRSKCSAAAFSAASEAVLTIQPSRNFQRKNIRLPAAHYRGRRIYFVTLCFHQRRAYGQNPRVARWLIAELGKHSAECEFYVHAYCVMPDHMHILAAAAADSSNLVKFVEAFKQDTAVVFQRKSRRRLWQFKYYDHVLRTSEPPDRVAWYIWLNPVRQGLCQLPAAYPFLGSFTEIGRRLLNSSATPLWTPPWKHAALKPAALHATPEHNPIQT